MESRRNSQALITSYIEKLRLAFIDVCNDESHINQSQFCEAFTHVFNGLTTDTVNQIYDEFIQSLQLQSTYTIYNNTINYNLLLNDDRLPRILIILHNYSISQITDFHRDIAYKLLDYNINTQNTNFYETSELQTPSIKYDSNQQILITSLVQKLRHSFSEICTNSSVNYDDFIETFNNVFIGIKEDIYKQIFNGFDILKRGEINYYKMLKDEKLPKILLLLYQNSSTQISHLQNEKIDNNNNDLKINGELPDNLNENFNFFEIISNLKKENKKLMCSLSTAKEEIRTLQEYNDKLDAIAIEWKDKYEIEIKQNKNYQIELECDLEEEYKTKLNKIIFEYENKLSEEKENYELLINEYNVKYEILLKEKEDEIDNTNHKYKKLLFDIEKEKQKQKNGMFNVINKLFNSTETDLTQFNILKLKQIGIIKLNILNKYNCFNNEKRLISIYGLIFDVTNCNKYNVNGIYSQFCGHDITLCVVFNKYSLKWCDKFVQLNYKQIQIVREYIKGFKKEFNHVGKLENYQEIQSNWPKLAHDQLSELQHDDDCVIM
eukprot:361767_1